ncbi:UNVERIFIED_CONTAM: hypothetical protein HHA_239270 [Hammondia hammondi]|eukprot:XP_008887503.1 hypothetical protein HHA_239270 [Hammondia hammondi]
MSKPDLLVYSNQTFSESSKVLPLIDKHRASDVRPRDLLRPWAPPDADAATLAGLEDQLNLPIQWSRLENTFKEYFGSLTQPGSGFNPSAFLDHSISCFHEVEAALMHLVRHPRRMVSTHIVSAILSQAAIAQFHISRFDAVVQAQSFRVTSQFATAALGRNKLAETIRTAVLKKLNITLEPGVVKEMLEHLFCKAAGGAVLDVVHGQGTATGSAHALNQVDRQAALSMTPDLLVLLFDVWLAERPDIRAKLPKDSVALLNLPSNNPAITTKRPLVTPNVPPTDELNELAVVVSPFEELANVVEPLVRFEVLPPDSEAGRWASEVKKAIIRRMKVLARVKHGFITAPKREAKRLLQHLVVTDFSLGHYTYLSKAYNIFHRVPDLRPVVAGMLSFSELHWRRLGVHGELALSLRRLLLVDLVKAFCQYHTDVTMAPRTPHILLQSVFSELGVFVRIWDAVTPLLQWRDAHPGVLESMVANQPSLIVQIINENRGAPQQTTPPMGSAPHPSSPPSGSSSSSEESTPSPASSPATSHFGAPMSPSSPSTPSSTATPAASPSSPTGDPTESPSASASLSSAASLSTAPRVTSPSSTGDQTSSIVTGSRRRKVRSSLVGPPRKKDSPSSTGLLSTTPFASLDSFSTPVFSGAPTEDQSVRMRVAAVSDEDRQPPDQSGSSSDSPSTPPSKQD